MYRLMRQRSKKIISVSKYKKNRNSPLVLRIPLLSKTSFVCWKTTDTHRCKAASLESIHLKYVQSVQQIMNKNTDASECIRFFLFSFYGISHSFFSFNWFHLTVTANNYQLIVCLLFIIDIHKSNVVWMGSSKIDVAFANYRVNFNKLNRIFFTFFSFLLIAKERKTEI